MIISCCESHVTIKDKSPPTPAEWPPQGSISGPVPLHWALPRLWDSVLRYSKTVIGQGRSCDFGFSFEVDGHVCYCLTAAFLDLGSSTVPSNNTWEQMMSLPSTPKVDCILAQTGQTCLGVYSTIYSIFLAKNLYGIDFTDFRITLINDNDRRSASYQEF